jgi:MFS family permease
MDAFDYFLLVFVITDVAKEFGTSKTSVAVATTLALAARPVGAALFGYWADKAGRRIPLIVNVIFYSLVEFSTGFCRRAPGAACPVHPHARRRVGGLGKHARARAAHADQLA